jgi:hypothetical protein
MPTISPMADLAITVVIEGPQSVPKAPKRS